MLHYLRSLSAGIFVVSAFILASAQFVRSEETAYDGLIEPNVVVNLGSPVPGLVESVDTERSSFVKKGDALIQLESSVQQAMVDRAEALVGTSAELKLQQEKVSFAARSLERMSDLYESEAISPQAKDKAETEASMARCILQKANEQRMLDRLELKRAQAMLELRTVRSPMSGVVMEIYVSPGEFIDQQPLLKLAEIDPLLVEVILPATLFGTIEIGQKAIVTPEIQTAEDYTATVTIVDKVMDASSSTFGVRLMLPNPDLTVPGGQRCSVTFLAADGSDAPADDPAMENPESNETQSE